MVKMRAPSRAGSTCGSVAKANRLLSSQATEDGTDQHPQAAEISFAQNVSGHDFSRGEYIPSGMPAAHLHLSAGIYFDAQVGKRDPGTQRIAQKRRTIDRSGPMRFLRREAAGVAIVQYLVIKPSRPDSLVKPVEGAFERVGSQSQTRGEFSDGVCAHRRK